MPGLTRVLPLLVAATVAVCAAGAAGSSARAPALGPSVEVVVTLPQPALADATGARALETRPRGPRRRLDLRAPASVSYLRVLSSAQRTLQARLAADVPEARVTRRFRIVLNGLAVALPHGELGRLRALPGVRVWPSVRYRALLDRTPRLIGAPTVWGPGLATAGQGMKIGIIDDGIDQTHPFFDPTGFAYPPGFPKGQTAFTTPKVIVARAFAPASATWRFARRAFDPQLSEHGTHVAGIAAGDADTLATGRARVSGIAPRAWLGNYKVLTVPTEGFGLDGNSPQIAAAIEAAVADGMDVLNLSLGEPEIDPARDVVVRAIDAAVDAGVVVAVAAGNDFGEAGRGSISSPANAAKAITAAAASSGRAHAADVIADFSSSGPTPVSLAFKPDVTAPGAGVLSSVPKREGSWAVFEGTSMASPHVAGAAAVLLQRHPGWTPAQVKSALASTGVSVRAADGGEALATREGGGRIDLVQADAPLLFTDPVGISFGLVGSGTRQARLAVADAGGGPAPWSVAVTQQTAEPAVSVVPSAPSVSAPGTVTLTLTVGAAAPERDVTGFVVLSRDGRVRRVPYWFRVARPQLGRARTIPLARPGVYRGDARRGAALVSTYRYPEAAPGVPTRLAGPEQVFRFRLTRPVANFGVAVVGQARGVRIQPRVAVAGDENRLVGYTAYPINLNPYQNFGAAQPVVGAVLPAPGTYDIVFDTASANDAGAFTFRFWVNDTKPPTLRFLGRSSGGTLAVRVTDAGAGVDPRSLHASIDGRERRVRWRGGRALVPLERVARGTHRLVVVAADYQEAKNMEDVGRILPNTRRLSVKFRVP